MNHYGVAREASVIYNLPLRTVDSKLPATSGKRGFPCRDRGQGRLRPLHLSHHSRCKYQAIAGAIAKRLLLVDQRPINNAADATNYTLWEMGHPTHVFDLDLLEGGKILVRRAFSGETLKTLDGVERKLTPEDLVIADAVKAGRAGRSHGRIRHHDYGQDAQHSDRSGLVRSGDRPQEFAPSRTAHRCIAPLRARRRL